MNKHHKILYVSKITKGNKKVLTLHKNSSKWLKSISKQVPTVWASTHHTPTASPHPVSILTPLHDRTEQKHLHERSEWHDASSCHPTSKHDQPIIPKAALLIAIRHPLRLGRDETLHRLVIRKLLHKSHQRVRDDDLI